MYIAESRETPCQTDNPELWFARHGTRDSMTAKRECYNCAERIECLNSVVKYEQKQGLTEHGIYGGMDAMERSAFLGLPVAINA